MRQLIFASILIVLAAVAAPSLMTRIMERRGAGETLSVAQTAAEPRRGGTPGSRAGQVEIKAARDGHFYVDAEINLRPVRLMVDTGASVVALRESDARLVGIRPRPGDFERPVQTANGTAFGADAELDSVAVREVEVDRVRALVLPDDQLSVSLLGASFLNRLHRFEVSDGTLVFEN